MSQTVDLGHLSYADAYKTQLEVAAFVKSGALDHTLLLVEHDPVLTLGASFHEQNLLHPVEEYERRGIAVTRTDRGGDVTYHGPHQLVIYPVFDVSKLGRDLHKWLRDLEEAMIVLLKQVGLEGFRFPPNTGVWIRNSHSDHDPKKIAAIGIKISRWVSLHGIALNCDNDLSPFGLIVPCGIEDYGVTSLSQELGRRFTIEEAKPLAIRAFEQVFGLSLPSLPLKELVDDARNKEARPSQASA